MRLLFAVPLVFLCLPAFADKAERFQLEKTAEGYVRLDTQSGEVSVCRPQGEGMVCRLAADDRQALEDETERLRSEVERLDARVTALEKTGAEKTGPALPSDAEVDRALGLFERFARGFLGIARELDREAEPAPDRT